MSNYESAAREIWKLWYEKDYRPLIDAVKESIKEHIKAFGEKNPNKKVYGYSIYTCNGFPHFGPVLNTTEELEKNDFDPYYKYCADEWSDWDDYSCFEKPKELLECLHQEFDECMQKFEDIYEEGEYLINEESELYWEKNVEKVYDSVNLALKELVSEGEFDWLDTDNKLILIWFSDPSSWEFSLAKDSVEALVGENEANEFSATLQ